ncbi:MAG: MoxR family ATPase [Alkalinema sp. RU_4_3]|nr:MoxR family ATPase [Alkalinema sp. RU_4_3]
MKADRLKFEGNKLLAQPEGSHPDAPSRPEPYIANPKLVTAVNLAIALNRPLLLEGDPGCGKTCLARAVAFELGLPYFRWNIQSTTKAQDGQYVYDALSRLYDVELVKGGMEAKHDPSSAEGYCDDGELGKAFRHRGSRSVLLIDEVDKAELDFPNDLLTLLDEPWEFTIRETGENVTADPDCLPIVFITSNKEKGNLPDAFLRRCLYHYVEFPSDAKLLKDIVQRHYEIQKMRVPETELPETELQEAAIDRFLSVRNAAGLKKKPGTSEFLDWLQALQSFGAEPYDAGTLKVEKGVPPYAEMLLKIREDWRKFEPGVQL